MYIHCIWIRFRTIQVFCIYIVFRKWARYTVYTLYSGRSGLYFQSRLPALTVPAMTAPERPYGTQVDPVKIINDILQVHVL